MFTKIDPKPTRQICLLVKLFPQQLFLKVVSETGSYPIPHHHHRPDSLRVVRVRTDIPETTESGANRNVFRNVTLQVKHARLRILAPVSPEILALIKSRFEIKL